MPRAYRVLCAVVGLLFIAGGLAFFLAFFGYHMPDSRAPIPTGPVGFYFVAFAGAALVGWGGSLVGASRRPESGRSAGTATAIALALCALQRMFAWFVGDYFTWPGEALRIEAAAFLLLALAFVWLRPRASAAGVGA